MKRGEIWQHEFKMWEIFESDSKLKVNIGGRKILPKFFVIFKCNTKTQT